MDIFKNFSIGTSHHADQFYPQLNFSWTQLFLSYLQNSAIWSWSLFLETMAMLFVRSKNLHDRIVQNTLRNIHTKLGHNLLSSFRVEEKVWKSLQMTTETMYGDNRHIVMTIPHMTFLPGELKNPKILTGPIGKYKPNTSLYLAC